MAADLSLLRAAQSGEAWLRLYSWNPPCLSFGRNEPALSRYDRERIAAELLDVVRRPTGGRAVWHEAEVTYAVAAPVEAFGSLTASYTLIHRLLVTALRSLGVDARMAARPVDGHSLLGAGACFAAPAGGEIVVGNRKMVGSAQVREHGAFLQHGSILLHDRQDVVSRVIRGAAAAPAATSLAQQLGRAPGLREVATAITSAVVREWNAELIASHVAPPEELARQFTDPAWTWRR